MLDGLSFMGKSAKPKGFNLKPRYYNETKDIIETRLAEKRARRAVAPIHNSGNGGSKVRFSKQLPRDFNSGSTLRLVVILIALIALSIWLIKLKF